VSLDDLHDLPIGGRDGLRQSPEQTDHPTLVLSKDTIVRQKAVETWIS